MVDCTHHYVEVAYEIFICKRCNNAVWQPHNYSTAVVYANEIEKMGREKAYKKRLQRMPKVSMLLDSLNVGDMDAIKDYIPEKVDESDKMMKILRRKGLADTILGEL